MGTSHPSTFRWDEEEFPPTVSLMNERVDRMRIQASGFESGFLRDAREVLMEILGLDPTNPERWGRPTRSPVFPGESRDRYSVWCRRFVSGATSGGKSFWMVSQITEG